VIRDSRSNPRVVPPFSDRYILMVATSAVQNYQSYKQRCFAKIIKRTVEGVVAPISFIGHFGGRVIRDRRTVSRDRILHAMCCS
jgi:hypothetical protein